jgi:hypothetical protein
MVVMLFRPSPQCPRPSLAAARRCWVACRDNIYMHEKQMQVGNVDTTWIFTQAMFMNVNTILWALSFKPVRLEYPRNEVERDLAVALDCIKTASFRWPGVESALELYRTLIPAYMRIYDQEGDVDASVGSPADTAAGYDSARSDTASPVARSATPGGARYPPPQAAVDRAAAASGGGATAPRPAYAAPPVDFAALPVDFAAPPAANGHAAAAAQQQQQQQYLSAAVAAVASASDAYPAPGTAPLFPPTPSSNGGAAAGFDANGAPQMPLPDSFFDFPGGGDVKPPAGTSAAAADGHPAAALPELWDSAAWTDCLHAPWAAPAQVARMNNGAAAAAGLGAEQEEGGFGGLGYAEHAEMMTALRDQGTGVIQRMVDATNAVFYPPGSSELLR